MLEYISIHLRVSIIVTPRIASCGDLQLLSPFDRGRTIKVHPVQVLSAPVRTDCISSLLKSDSYWSSDHALAPALCVLYSRHRAAVFQPRNVPYTTLG